MPKREEYLFDVQAPFPEINLTHLTVTQRNIVDLTTKVVVGVSVAWYSLLEIADTFNDLKRKRKLHD